jgi:hypothetical protein
MVRLFFVLTLLASQCARLHAQPPSASAVKFAKERLTLSDAIAELQSQTGNVIVDRRTKTTNQELEFKPASGPFWQMLDAIGAQGISFSAYQDGGSVALVDAPYRRVATHYSSIFRFAVKRTTVSRDEETKAHSCQLTIDAAWEPRFQMLYVNLNDAEFRFAKQVEKVERQSARSVAGIGATEIELLTPAPPRAIGKIDMIKGNIRAVGVPKMLELTFPQLSQKPVLLEGVNAELTHVKKETNRWTVELYSDDPPGAETLESFQQSWRDNNRVWLSYGMDPKTKKPYELEPSAGPAQPSKTGMKMKYFFTSRGDVALPAAGAPVTLHYRMPSRVQTFTVPFEFHDLPLP